MNSYEKGWVVSTFLATFLTGATWLVAAPKVSVSIP